MPDGTVAALDVGVLPGLPGLDVLDGDSLLTVLYQSITADAFRASIDPYGAAPAVPFDDAVQASDTMIYVLVVLR